MATTDDVPFNYGDMNSVSVSIESREENDIIKIGLNGKTIFNHLSLEPVGDAGFFGVMSQRQKVIIAE